MKTIKNLLSEPVFVLLVILLIATTIVGVLRYMEHDLKYAIAPILLVSILVLFFVHKTLVLNDEILEERKGQENFFKLDIESCVRNDNDFILVYLFKLCEWNYNDMYWHVIKSGYGFFKDGVYIDMYKDYVLTVKFDDDCNYNLNTIFDLLSVEIDKYQDYLVSVAENMQGCYE